MQIADTAEVVVTPAPTRLQLMRVAISFLALVFSFLIGIVVWNEWKSYQDQLAQMETASVNLAQALAQHAEDAIKVADIQLIDMVERGERDGRSPGSVMRLQALFRSKVATLPQLHGLFMFDEHGRYLASSQPSLPAHLTIESREYFRHHRDDPERGPFIGPPAKSLTTGDWMVTVSRRINYPDGRFAGVVSATLYMDYFRNFYRRFNIGDEGRISVLFDNGRVLTQRPFNEDVVGQHIANGLFTQGYFSGRRTGSFRAVSTIDGIPRLFGFQYLERYPLLVTVALSERERFAPWRVELYSHIAALTLIAFILGTLGWRLLQQIRYRISAEEELARSHESLKRLSHDLESMAMQDSLTSLANRRYFNIALSQEFGNAQRWQRPLSLLLLDVDYFKQYNDTYGHIAGDECLRRIGAELKDKLYRSSDLAARYGGEEFAVLLPDTDGDGALATAERLRTAIEALDMEHETNAAGVVTVSIGINTLTQFDIGLSSAQFIDGADKALYKAKNQGRNRSYSCCT